MGSGNVRLDKPVRLDQFYLDLFRQIIVYGFLGIVTIILFKASAKVHNIYEKGVQDAMLNAHGNPLPFEKFKYEVTQEGHGMEAQMGDMVWYKWKGYLAAAGMGKKGEFMDVDMSINKFQVEKGFQLEWGKLFPGMLITVAGDPRLGVPPMRVGEKRTSYVPSEHAFGLNARTQFFMVRQFADLILEVELMRLQRLDCFAPGITMEDAPYRFTACQKDLQDALVGPMDSFNNMKDDAEFMKTIGG